MSVKGVEVQLFDADDNAVVSTSGIEVCWFDVDNIPDLSSIKGKSATVSTDSSGWIKLNIENVSGLAVGEWGFLICYLPDGTDYRDSPIFASRMQVASITSGDDMYPVSDWVRNPSWLELPDVSGLQKFAGLHAVYPDSNFVALSAEGNFTVNWGDGSGDTNVSSGVTAERNIAWADAPNTSDIGIADAVAVTFTDSGDTVNRTAHGWNNGQQVAFSSITSTTGISTYTTYYIINKAADTFQVATTLTGSAIALTTNGSGSCYTPKYRQVIVTVVPNGGNITKLNLNIKHSTSGLLVYSTGWLDIVISAQYMTDLRFGSALRASASVLVRQANIEQFSIISSNLRQLGDLFYSCYRLASVPQLVISSAASSSISCTFTDAGDLVTSAGHGLLDGDSVIFTSITSTTGIVKNVLYSVRDKTTDTFKVALTEGGTAIVLTTDGSGTAKIGTVFIDLFYGCYPLQSVPILNTSGVISFSNMFNNCYSLQSVPLYDTSAAIDFSYMFNNCYTLQSVPLYDTSAGINFSYMFYSCNTLQSVPLLDTSVGTDFSYMFYGCYSLQSVPLYDTSAGTNFSNMFRFCYSLQSVPLLDTAAGTNFSYMFYGCYPLQSVPLYDTSAGTNFTFMFSTCSSIKSIPLLNTSQGTNFAQMFASCSALQSLPLFNTTSGTDFSYMFASCKDLDSVPAINTSGATAAFTSIFSNDTSLRWGVLKGTAKTISYANCKLGSAALDAIYTELGTGTSQTITVTGNYGVTGDTPSIATAKGWTVTG